MQSDLHRSLRLSHLPVTLRMGYHPIRLPARLLRPAYAPG